MYLVCTEVPPVKITLPISVDAAKLSGRMMDDITKYGIRPHDRNPMLQPMTAKMLTLVVEYCENHVPGKTVDPVAERARLTLETGKQRMILVTAASHLRIQPLRELTIQIFCDHEQTDGNQTCVKIQSNLAKVFELSIEAAQQSKVLADILKTWQGKLPVNPIPLDFEKGELEIAQKWMEHHKGDPIPEVNGEDSCNSDFDRELFKVDKMMLVRLIRLAWFYDIKGLERSAKKSFTELYA